MREIKFRAWEDDAKFFVYLTMGDLLFGSEGFGISSGLDRIKSMLEETSKNPSSDERIQQYTGLRDKNGKEIYEGDILDMGRKHLSTIAQVVWADKMAAFVAASPDSFLNLSNTGAMCDGKCEVIGNIYENPELIKKEKE